MELSVTTGNHPGRVCVVRPRGDLDVCSAPRFREVLDELIGGGEDDLVLDMAAVEFMDCRGLAVVVDALHRVLRRGGSVHLAATRAPVDTLLRATGLCSLIPVHDRVEEAVRVLRGDAFRVARREAGQVPPGEAARVARDALVSRCSAAC